jgi:hypothetical protein
MARGPISLYGATNSLAIVKYTGVGAGVMAVPLTDVVGDGVIHLVTVVEYTDTVMSWSVDVTSVGFSDVPSHAAGIVVLTKAQVSKG